MLMPGPQLLTQNVPGKSGWSYIKTADRHWQSIVLGILEVIIMIYNYLFIYIIYFLVYLFIPQPVSTNKINERQGDPLLNGWTLKTNLSLNYCFAFCYLHDIGKLLWLCTGFLNCEIQVGYNTTKFMVLFWRPNEIIYLKT